MDLALCPCFQELVNAYTSRRYIQLPQHAQLVPVVPAVDQLSGDELDNRHPCQIYFVSRGRKAQAVSFMSACDLEAHCYFVSFGQHIFNLDMEIREGVAHVAGEWLELCRAVDFGIGLGQTKSYALR